MIPTLTTFPSPKVGPSRQSVLPQSGQKWEVIWFPVSSPFFAIVFGLPDVTEKPSPGTMMFVEYVEPVILRQLNGSYISCGSGQRQSIFSQQHTQCNGKAPWPGCRPCTECGRSRRSNLRQA